jgi:hypothetical protein
LPFTHPPAQSVDIKSAADKLGVMRRPKLVQYRGDDCPRDGVGDLDEPGLHTLIGFAELLPGQALVYGGEVQTLQFFGGFTGDCHCEEVPIFGQYQTYEVNEFFRGGLH